MALGDALDHWIDGYRAGNDAMAEPLRRATRWIVYWAYYKYESTRLVPKEEWIGFAFAKLAELVEGIRRQPGGRPKKAHAVQGWDWPDLVRDEIRHSPWQYFAAEASQELLAAPRSTQYDRQKAGRPPAGLKRVRRPRLRHQLRRTDIEDRGVRLKTAKPREGNSLDDAIDARLEARRLYMDVLESCRSDEEREVIESLYAEKTVEEIARQMRSRVATVRAIRNRVAARHRRLNDNQL
jgi:hypothetical protein